MAQQSKIKLLIADDHEMVRSGLKSWLAGTEIKIVAAVAGGQAAVKYALENDVDVVLLTVSGRPSCSLPLSPWVAAWASSATQTGKHKHTFRLTLGRSSGTE